MNVTNMNVTQVKWAAYSQLHHMTWKLILFVQMFRTYCNVNTANAQFEYIPHPLTHCILCTVRAIQYSKSTEIVVFSSDLNTLSLYLVFLLVWLLTSTRNIN